MLLNDSAHFEVRRSVPESIADEFPQSDHLPRRKVGGDDESERRPGERVRNVRFTEDVLVVDLLDGRTISVPLVWFPRLLSATPEQRANWRVAGGRFGIHWPDVDEDLSTEGLLRGAPAPRGSAPTGRAAEG